MYQVMLKEIVMSKLNSFWAKNKLMKQPASDELSDRYHSLRAEVVSLKNQLTKVYSVNYCQSAISFLLPSIPFLFFLLFSKKLYPISLTSPFHCNFSFPSSSPLHLPIIHLRQPSSCSRIDLIECLHVFTYRLTT